MIDESKIDYWFKEIHHRKANQDELAKFKNWNFSDFIKYLIDGTPNGLIGWTKPIHSDWIITAQFGQQLWYGKHKGIDIKTKCFDYPKGIGNPAFSCGQGLITKAGYDLKGGKYIDIKHNAKFRSRYYHLSVIEVKQGWFVKSNREIAKTGNTGILTRGAHLHWELYLNNQVVNPLNYLG